MTVEQLLRNLQVPEKPVNVVLDTDAFNEIDDQFALAYLLSCQHKLKIKALYAAPFLNDKSSDPEDGMRKSYDEILKILELANHGELAKTVYKGSKAFLRDESTAVESDAARDIVEKAAAASPDQPLYIVAIGAITNVASALLMKPDIKDNIVVVWLGGHSYEYHDTREFNMYQDVAAARIVFGCGAPVVQLPCMGVVDAFTTTGPELNHWLLNPATKTPLSQYLAENTIQEAESYAKGKVWSRVIWDVTAVGWLMNTNERFMRSRIVHSPIPTYDNLYSYDLNRHFLRYVYSINRDALLGDLFEGIIKRI